MAFDFGKMANKVTGTVTKLGQDASAMTKNVTENVKINSAINEQKKIIEAAYSMLGKKYYEKHSDDSEEEFNLEISRINDAKQKISELERKLSDVKSGSQSGVKLTPGAVFCTQCGAKLTPGAAFCTKCGAKVNMNEPQPVQPAQFVQQPSSEHPVQQEQKESDSADTSWTSVQNDTSSL